MKFVCEQCKTKYSIDDARVRGKMLKVRCKACQNLITVCDPAWKPVADAAAPGGFSEDRTQVTALPAQAAAVLPISTEPATPRAEWFLSFGGDQEGPFTLEQAVGRLRGSAAQSGFAWRDGFPEWLAAEQVPELAEALAAASASASPSAVVGVPLSPMEEVAPTARSRRPIPNPTLDLSPLVSEFHSTTINAVDAVRPPPTSPAASALQSRPVAAPAANTDRLAAAVPPPKAEGERAAADAAIVSSGARATEPAARPETTPAPERKTPVAVAAKPLLAGVPAGSRLATRAGTPAATAAVARATSDAAAPVTAKTPTPAEKASALAAGAPTAEPLLTTLRGVGPGLMEAQKVATAAAGAIAGETTAPTGQPLVPPRPGSGNGVIADRATAAAVAAGDATATVWVTPPSATAPWIRQALMASLIVILCLSGAVGYLLWAKMGHEHGVPARPEALRSPPPIDDRPVAVAESPIVAHGAPAPTATKPSPSTNPAAPATEPARNRGARAPAPAAARPRPAGRGEGGDLTRMFGDPGSRPGLSSRQSELAKIYGDEEKAPSGSDQLPRLHHEEKSHEPVSDSQIRSVVTRNMKSLTACFERVLKHDESLKNARVDVDLKIGISGSVTRVSYPDPRYANSEIGSCLSQTIRRWHFPPQDREYQTSFPLLLQAQ